LVSYLCENQEAAETTHWVETAGRLNDRRRCCRSDPLPQVADRALQTFGRLDILINNGAFQATHDSADEITDGGSYLSGAMIDDDRRYARSRDDEGRFTSSRSRSRYDDDDDDRRGSRGHGGWYGDPEGHSEAARRGRR